MRWALAFLLCVGCLACSHKSSAELVDEAAGQKKSELPELDKEFPELPAFDGDLFLIFAHADDELLSLAYVAKLRERFPEKPIHWILVTDSGKGWVVPFSCVGISTVKCRAEEAKAAAACVGIGTPYEMRLHDGSLKNYKDLDQRILNTIQKLKVGKIGAVLTSDNTGVYGHPDHLAVHDSVQRLSKSQKWTVITNALPAKFREKIKLRESAKNRVDPPITHIVDIDDSLKAKMVCAIKAHKSQRVVLWFMNQMQAPADFLAKVPRQFFHLDVF